MTQERCKRLWPRFAGERMAEVSIWSVVPTRVRKSKDLTGDDKELYYLLADRLTKAGYCRDTNADLAKMLGVSERAICYSLKKLKEKKFIFVRQYDHARRLIYVNIPGEPSDEPKPSDEQLQDKTESYLESLKKAIVFGTIEFPVLVEKLLESPYLENVEDNSRQFLMTEKQAKFLVEFKKLVPNKKIDCQIACYPNVDYEALLRQIKQSDLLMKGNNLSLKWCLQHSESIISGTYRKLSDKNFHERDYSGVDLNLLWMDIDEIEI